MTGQSDQMLSVLTQAAEMRGVELTKAEALGYADALRYHPVVSVWDALAGLWRDAEKKAMPTPGQIRERIKSDGRARASRQPLIDGPTLTEREHAFGLECAANCSLLLASKIDGKEADRRMVAAAKEHGVYDAIRGQVGCDGVPL